MVSFFLSFTNASILSNDEIDIYLERDRTQHPDQKLGVGSNSSPLFRYDIVLKNKTNKSIYVDLANCFKTATQWCFDGV